jgi:hypothetical protein
MSASSGYLALVYKDSDTSYGVPIPQPRSIEQLRDDPEFVADAADAVVAFVRPQAERAAAE